MTDLPERLALTHRHYGGEWEDLTIAVVKAYVDGELMTETEWEEQWWKGADA